MRPAWLVRPRVPRQPAGGVDPDLGSLDPEVTPPLRWDGSDLLQQAQHIQFGLLFRHATTLREHADALQFNRTARWRNTRQDARTHAPSGHTNDHHALSDRLTKCPNAARSIGAFEAIKKVPVAPVPPYGALLEGSVFVSMLTDVGSRAPDPFTATSCSLGFGHANNVDWPVAPSASWLARRPHSRRQFPVHPTGLESDPAYKHARTYFLSLHRHTLGEGFSTAGRVFSRRLLLSSA